MSRKLCLLIPSILVLASTANAALPGLAAHWRFDEGSGTIAQDSSGNGNDGTLNGDPEWVAGQVGGALQFNGSNAYVRAPHIPFDNRSFTVAMWVNPVLYTGEQVVFSQGLTGANNTDMHFRLGGPGSGNVPAGGVRMGFYNNDLDTAGGIIQDNNWYHITFWYDFENQNRRIYIDGVQQAEAAATPYLGTSGDTIIGAWGTGQWFRGIIDDVQVYNRAVTDAEILAIMSGLGGYPYASSPYPADGAMYTQTWANLTWRAGDYAVSHDVYFGEDFDDVNEATRESDVFRANQTEDWFIVGFPGYPYATGLSPGTTYYWRIDEVNDANDDSPWKGPVWGFWLPPRKAYNPDPPDGTKFVDPNADLSWSPGWNAAMHYVYFGEDYDTVLNATGATGQAATTYNPGTMEFEKTYYWRVDEFDGTAVRTGDVWSFTVTREGGGLKGQYYHHSGITPPDPPSSAFRVLVLTRLDPTVDFDWGDPGSPDASVNVDDFSAMWTGEVEAAFSEPYTFYTNTDDGVMLWVNDQLVIDNWTDHSPTENSSEPIELVAGQRYPITMWWYERGGGAVAQLSWQSPSQPKGIIPAGALSPPVRAYAPRPGNGAVNVSQTPTLSWTAGDKAASHNVYFGSAPDALNQVATKMLGNESHGPLGPLEWDKTYYWRVDEVNNLDPDSPWTGNVWSFTVANFLIVDDFESYTDDVGNRIFQTWIDGWGYTEPEVVLGNGTGSTVGHLQPPFAEQTIVNSGGQSMPFDYNNTGAGGKFYYSETERTWDSPQDWTREGVKALTLYFRGYPPIFVEDPPGTYTMSADGNDIWDYADQFRYAVKRLNGNGSIVAQVLSVSNTNAWAKAGVMIRESLESRSAHAMVVVTPGSGLSFQRRPLTGGPSEHTTQGGITAPHWVKLTRSGDTFTAQHSDDGATWVDVTDGAGGLSSVSIAMPANVYIGLCLTSHSAGVVCVAEFSDVATTGSVTGQWQVRDIGIEHPGNEAEQLYIAVEDSANNVKVINHTNSKATTLDTWQEWNTDLRDITGVNLTAVKKMYIGVGDRDAPQRGGAGTLYFDDIRLYKPRCVASIIKPDADLSGNCVVDLADIEVLASQWLQSGAGLSADLYADEAIDLKDLAEIGEAWLEQQLWPQP